MAVEHFSSATGNVIPGTTTLTDVVVTGSLEVEGIAKAENFQATTDGTEAVKAYGWESDPNLGLQREGADVMSLGVQANEPIRLSQFGVSINESFTLAAGNLTTSILSPAALGAGPTANYSPTGWSGTIRVMRQDMSASGAISGLVALSNGSRITLVNIASAGRTITLSHEAAGSTAANRFLCPNNVDFLLVSGASVELMYDGTSARWRILSVVA